MKNRKNKNVTGIPTTVLLAIGIMFSIPALSQSKKALRISEVTSKMVKQIEQGSIEELTIEFRSGDQIPLSFHAEGDLLETKDPNSLVLSVKRGFFVRIQKDRFLFSLDGQEFKSIQETIGGSLMIGANPDAPEGGVVTSLQVMLRAFLK